MAVAKPIISKDPPPICFVTNTANTGPKTLKPALIKKSDITNVRMTWFIFMLGVGSHISRPRGAPLHSSFSECSREEQWGHASATYIGNSVNNWSEAPVYILNKKIEPRKCGALFSKIYKCGNPNPELSSSPMGSKSAVRFCKSSLVAEAGFKASFIHNLAANPAT